MLQRLKLDIDASPPRSEFETRFIRASRADEVIAELWKHVQTVRTCEELVGDYVAALRANALTPAAAQLKEIALDAWPTLLRAFEGGRYREDVILTDRHAEICPKCRMALPTIEARKYRDRPRTRHSVGLPAAA